MAVSTAAAIIGSAVVGAGASAYSSKKASKAAQKGYDAAAAEQARQYDQTREDYAPWREAGQGALGRLTDASEGDFSAFTKSPGYEFRRDEGMRNVGNFFSAKGSGGNALKALAEWNQNVASNEYGNWWNRQAGLAGVGQSATAGTAAAGANAAANISNAYIGAGNARASGVMGVNNAIQSGIGAYLYGQGRTGGSSGAPSYPAGYNSYWDEQAATYGG